MVDLSLPGVGVVFPTFAWLKFSENNPVQARYINHSACQVPLLNLSKNEKSCAVWCLPCDRHAMVFWSCNSPGDVEKSPHWFLLKPVSSLSVTRFPKSKSSKQVRNHNESNESFSPPQILRASGWSWIIRLFLSQHLCLQCLVYCFAVWTFLNCCLVLLAWDLALDADSTAVPSCALRFLALAPKERKKWVDF